MSLIPSKIGPLHEPAHDDFLSLNDEIGDREVQIRKGATNRLAHLCERGAEAFRSEVDARQGTRRVQRIRTSRQRLLAAIRGSDRPGSIAPLTGLLRVPSRFEIVTDERFPLIC